MNYKFIIFCIIGNMFPLAGRAPFNPLKNSSLELKIPSFGGLESQLYPQVLTFNLKNKVGLLKVTDCVKRLDNIDDPTLLTSDRYNMLLSPDGQYLSYLQWSRGSCYICTLSLIDSNDSSTILIPNHHGVCKYGWCYNTDYLWYTQDNQGDENYHIYIANQRTATIKDLTPFANISAKIIKLSSKHPNLILIGINNLDARYHDVYKIDISTNSLECIESAHTFSNFIADNELDIKFATNFSPLGEKQIYYKQADNQWILFDKIPFEDAFFTNLLHISNDGTELYCADSRHHGCAALTSINLPSKHRTVLAYNNKADLNKIMCNPKTLKVEAASFPYLENYWHFLDTELQKHYNNLKKRLKKELYIVSRTKDDSLWLIKAVSKLGQTSYFIYCPSTQETNHITTFQEGLDEEQAAPMNPKIIINNDGMEMVCYLTLPNLVDPDHTGKPQAPTPMILLVHGGPWARDYWHPNNFHQYLARLGYSVLSVNFRGSSGFGKNFLNAGIGQWKDKMHEDLLDAVKWAIENKVADPNKIAIMGGSYGGYAVLTALIRSPHIFACGIDLFGPTNLITLLDSLPEYWKTDLDWLRKMLGGDECSVLGREFLKEQSPINYVEQIARPLLICQGSNDVRVKQFESDQIVQAMRLKNVPVIYAIFPDEGHGFVKEENQNANAALIEQFLAKYLKGVDQTVIPETLRRSSVIIS